MKTNDPALITKPCKVEITISNPRLPGRATARRAAWDALPEEEKGKILNCMEFSSTWRRQKLAQIKAIKKARAKQGAK